MKDTKRALRRHHRRRIIARTMKLLVVWSVPEEVRLQQALRWYKHRQKCSCYLCGHRRKWGGSTVQERRQSSAAESDTQYEILCETEAVNLVLRACSQNKLY